MSFKEYLISTGLTDEQAESIVKGMPNNKFYLASEEKLDERYEKLKSQKEQADEQLEAHQKELDALKESAKGNEELTQQLAESQATIDTLKSESESKLLAQEKDFSIKLALKEANALDTDIVLSQLDKDTIKVVDGKLQGFDEQLKGLQESKAFLFKQDEPDNPSPSPTITLPGNPKPPSTNGKDISKMSYQELKTLKDSNPTEFAKLTQQ
ncbi:phage scaffolding protein [Vagococcus fluvialis]|uniref:phage scaffolding protein n=1 Tax=Vagococcus fluvialis TaxID=2738 RepID=UPI001D0B4FCF|nr:phage scaffolding protein [Vagococcus fluvialis]UDM79594.1 phage scaffolding protein [Vagococcus fluvialis]